MAKVDLQKFLESRLLALHPEEDISSGSPAQVKFIQPLLTYLGTDPFETDVETFISDRFQQEFPDIYESNPGAIRDVLVNPLRVLLEPWKREIQLIKRNQTFAYPSLLSDDDADALAANYFATRPGGGYSTGTVRAYYTNPIDQQLEITTRIYSKGDLSFFPTSLVNITAEQMLFNRDGSLYYLDIPVQAETQGSQYNIDRDEIVGMDGGAAVRVTNLSAFNGGFERQDTESLVSTMEVALNEQSLVTDRGATARIPKTFPGAIKDVQVLGARDPEMQRDLLVGTSPGHAWITGQVDLFSSLAYVRSRTLEGQESDTPKAGDTLYVYLNRGDLPQTSRFLRLQVDELLTGPNALSDLAFQYAYLVRWSDPAGNIARIFPDEASRESFYSSLPASYEGGFSKRGQLRISSVPGARDVNLEVEDQSVHVYGHSDVYVRPSTFDTKTAVITAVSDLGTASSTSANPHFSLERLALVTTVGSNMVRDGSGINFVDAGVAIGDCLVIDNGADAGIYTVLRVDGISLYLNQSLTTTSPANSSLHYRVVRSIRASLFEPRTLHFPFGDLPKNVLNTVIGSTMVYISDVYPEVDVIAFGAAAGDTLRILSGLDAGDYKIVGFDATLGGRGIVLDQPMKSTASWLAVEVFTSMDKVERPLVRVKSITLLDSSRQSTGLTIPPADPVAVVPVGKLSSAQVRGSSSSSSGFVLPDLQVLTGYTNHASSPAGRYSSGIDSPLGTYVSLSMSDGSQVELDLLSETSGKCSFFMMTPESIDNEVNAPPIKPRIGECLSIKDGPNRGDYLIKNVYELKYATGSASTVAYENIIYFVQIYGEFPSDPLRQLMEFLTKFSGAHGLEASVVTFPILFPSFFNNPTTGWYKTLGYRLHQAMDTAGVLVPSDVTAHALELQRVIESLTKCSYECGVPARGVLRTFFREPTLFEQWTGDASVVTEYAYDLSSSILKFRPDPLRYTRHQVVPARTTSDAQVSEYPRDLVVMDAGQTATFSDISRLSIFSAGVRPGDLLSVHEEIYAYEGGNYVPELADILTRKQTLVQTFAGSAQLTAIPGAGDIFFGVGPGNLLFIEEGQDVGCYRVTRVIDPKNVIIDRPLQAATPVVLKSGPECSCVYSMSSDIILAPSGTPFSALDVSLGRYITIYGNDYAWMGSYRIIGLHNNGQGVTVSLPSGHFPTSAFPQRWAVTEAPTSSPSSLVREAGAIGTVPVAGRPIRMYETLPREFPILSVTPSSSSSSAGVSYTAGSAFNLEVGMRQPYRILRSNVRKITPTEMNANRDGALYYFDTEIVSLSPSSLANIPAGSYLTLRNGTYRSVGYRHVVSDPSFTYSTQEDGYIDLPISVMPTDADDFPDSLVRVLGSPVEILYETSSIVSLVQEFVDSKKDRTTSSNMLVRHFLPAYVSYDAAYSGGSSTSVVAADLVRYIDSIPSATAIDVSVMQDIVSQRGGNLDTPTRVAVTIHDWDRRMWVEFSEDKVGGPNASDTLVPYAGTPRVTYFVAGPSASGSEAEKPGERISLSRR